MIDQYTSVAVTGAHGKTSTTGLLSHVMNGDKRHHSSLVMVLEWVCQVVTILHLKRVNTVDTFKLSSRLCNYD